MVMNETTLSRRTFVKGSLASLAVAGAAGTGALYGCSPQSEGGAGAGETVTFDQVLAVNNGELQIGCPTVAGATVTATVEKEGKGKKVIVYKYKRKTGYHKKNGHRQLFTQVKIEKINA